MTTFSESFNKADSTILGPDLTWTEVVSTTLQVVSNTLRSITSVTQTRAYARAEHDTGTADQFAQVTAVALSAGTVHIAPCVRFSSSADTHYDFVREVPAAGAASGKQFLRKTVAGVETILTSIVTRAFVAGEVIRVEVAGSSLQGLIDGVVVATVTDTSITGNTRTGVGIYKNPTAAGATADNFSSGDLARLTGSPQTVTLGLPAHTTTSLAVTRGKTRTVGLAAQASTSPALGRAKVRAVSVAGSSGIASPLVRVKTRQVALATEVAGAHAWVRSKTWTVGQPVGGASTPSLVHLKSRAVGLPQENEVGQALVFTGARSVLLSLVVDASLAHTPRRIKAQQTGTAIEVATASPPTGSKQAPLGLAEAQGASLALSWAKALLLGRPDDVTEALSMSRAVQIIRGVGSARVASRAAASCGVRASSTVASSTVRARGEASVR